MLRQTSPPTMLVGLLTAVLLSASRPDGAGAAPGDAGACYVRVPAANARQLAVVPAGRVFDYGSFHWLEVSAAELDRLRTAELTPAPRCQDFTLRLGEQSFDPLVDDPELGEGWKSHPAGADLHLVQLYGPVRAEWLDRLGAAGLKVVQYLHPFTYVVWGKPDRAVIPRADDFVRWTGFFQPAYRLLPRWRSLPSTPVRVDVLLFRGADPGAATAQIEALGAIPLGSTNLDARFELAMFMIAGDQLAAAAGVAGVYSVQLEPTDGGLRGEMSNQVNVSNVDGTNRALPGYETWLAGAGLSGAGVLIANVDGGIEEGHPDLAARMATCTGTTCGTLSSTSNHGTHTAGIMAGDGTSGTTDSFGFLRGLGMAPGAQLIEQIYESFFTEPGGMRLLMADSSRNGAELSGNSWGPAETPLGYDNDTLQVDLGVRDAEPNTDGNQEFTYVLSIMNGNGGESTQGTPDEAKNVFTIGSTKMQEVNGSQILAINDLSSNSAHGPALDGRKIPHLVAPGCSVDSTVTGGDWGLLCGTSMASPHVSGAVALFIEYYRGTVGGDPSPALIKAAFLPVAHDLAGHLDADGSTLGHPFDSKQGWGRLNLEAVVRPEVEVVYFDNPQVLDNTGEEWTEALVAADPTKPVRMMLVWTDAPGHGLGGSTPAWNNDLDLIVTTDAGTYLGNDFGPDGWSQLLSSRDEQNNTEGVFLGPTPPVAFVVTVRAANLNSDAIPGEGDGTDQDFALVCYNCQRSRIFSDGFEAGTTENWSATVNE